MFGILSNPIVTLMWALEQIDIILFGSTPRTSDIRILLSFLLNCGCVCAIFAAFSYLGYENALLVAVALAFIASHNIFFSLGI